MIQYAGKVENFWQDDLDSHTFCNVYNFGNTRDYHHQNLKGEVSIASQSFNNELPQYWRKFLDHFDLAEGSVSWTLLEPGRIVPIHQDLFVVLRKNHNVDLENCVRYIVMLEDWQFGQTMEFKDQVIRKWQSGDCWAFDHTEPHWAVNASNCNFYTCQISSFKDL